MLNNVINGTLGACLLLLTGCEGTTLGSFSTSEDIPAIRVEGGGLISLLPTEFSPFKLDVKSSEAFKSAEYDVVNEINITNITLRILPESENTETDANENGVADDFSFISALSLYIQADIGGVSQRELIAELPDGFSNSAEAARVINMQMTGIDVLGYVEAAGGYNIESEAQGSAPADAVIFGGTVGYRVKVGFR